MPDRVERRYRGFVRVGRGGSGGRRSAGGSVDRVASDGKDTRR